MQYRWISLSLAGALLLGSPLAQAADEAKPAAKPATAQPAKPQSKASCSGEEAEAGRHQQRDGRAIDEGAWRGRGAGREDRSEPAVPDAGLPRHQRDLQPGRLLQGQGLLRRRAAGRRRRRRSRQCTGRAGGPARGLRCDPAEQRRRRDEVMATCWFLAAPLFSSPVVKFSASCVAACQSSASTWRGRRTSRGLSETPRRGARRACVDFSRPLMDSGPVAATARSLSMRHNRIIAMSTGEPNPRK